MRYLVSVSSHPWPSPLSPAHRVNVALVGPPAAPGPSAPMLPPQPAAPLASPSAPRHRLSAQDEATNDGRRHSLPAQDANDGRRHSLSAQDEAASDGRRHTPPALSVQDESANDGRRHNLPAQDANDGRRPSLSVQDEAASDGRRHSLPAQAANDGRRPSLSVQDLNGGHRSLPAQEGATNGGAHKRESMSPRDVVANGPRHKRNMPPSLTLPVSAGPSRIGGAPSPRGAVRTIYLSGYALYYR